jgi:translation initiation factor eIF-2B subunit gamma
MPSQTSVVILGGGIGRRFGCLTSREAPKALLPLANAPLISYPVEWVCAAGLREATVVVGASSCRTAATLRAVWLPSRRASSLSPCSLLCALLLHAAGDTAAAAVQRWVTEEYKGPCALTVVGASLKHTQRAALLASTWAHPALCSTPTAVPEDKGTAGALRAVAPRLKHDQVVVLSGDLVCDMPLGTLLARHRTSEAVATVLLASRRASLSPEPGKPGKAPPGVDYVGLDASQAVLCFCAAGKDVKDSLQLPRAVLRAVGDVTLHTSLVDVQAYMFSVAPVVQHLLLEAKPGFTSLRRDVLPYLVRKQFEAQGPRMSMGQRTDSQGGLDGGAPAGDSGAPAERLAGGAQTQLLAASQPAALIPGGIAPTVATPPTPDATTPPAGGAAAGLARQSSLGLRRAAGSVDGLSDGILGGVSSTVGVMLAPDSAFCCRVDSLRAYLELNRDLALPEAAHITGLPLNKAYDNFLHPQVELGAKAVVGSGCIVGFGTKLGDKATLKRSIMGRRCRVGTGAKVSNCVVHDDVTIADGAHIQGSVVGQGAVLGTGCVLRDCHVASGAAVAAGADHKNEQLTPGS